MARPRIIKFLHNRVRRALGLIPPGRNLCIFPDDVFLVSFPKSGNTWTRFLVANLMFPNTAVTFDNIESLIPEPISTPRKDFDRLAKPRIIKSHDCFDPRYSRVIYIVRDPRDIVLSQYHYNRKIKGIADDLPIETFVARFLAGETCPHASWGQNVLTWIYTSEGSPRFLLLRYEDMLADTPRELRKIVAFLGLNITAKQIADAVERSSADRMRSLEQAQSVPLDLMGGKDSRRDLMFVRAAVSGGWRKDLPMPLVEKIEAAWGSLMHHLGYELAAGRAGRSPSPTGYANVQFPEQLPKQSYAEAG